MISTHLFLPAMGMPSTLMVRVLWRPAMRNMFVLTLSRVVKLLYSKCNLYLLYVLSAQTNQNPVEYQITGKACIKYETLPTMEDMKEPARALCLSSHSAQCQLSHEQWA